jgi:hypothetical protein
MKLLVKFPTRGRQEQFFKTFEKYHELCENKNETFFLVSIDEDDLTMNNNEVISKIKNFKNTTLVIGNSKSKIHAVNRDLDTFDKDWDIVLLASDDMIPIVNSYDNIIRNNMMFNYPDGDGILWFNDGYQGNRLNTLCILGKKYYNRFGYIYHPDYKSCWSDNEFMTVGNILKKQVYIDQVIIRHEHPDWGFGEKDFIHQNNINDWHHDYSIYQQRNSINFGV